MSNDLTPLHSRFTVPNNPADRPGRQLDKLVPRQGKLLSGWGPTPTEEPLGERYIAKRAATGYRHLARNEKPIYIMDVPGQRTPERHELGDTDSALWPIGPNGPSDPWSRVAQIELVRERDGHRFLFEASAATAYDEVDDLIRRIVWEGAQHNPNASPIITIGVRQARNAKGTWYVPMFSIPGWTDDDDTPDPASQHRPPRPDPIAPVDVTPQSPPAAPRPRLARDTYQQPVRRPVDGRQSAADLRQHCETPGSLADELDDEIPF